MATATASSSWRTATLGEFFRIKHGYAFKGEFFSESGPYILLTPGNFNPDGGIKLKGENEKYYGGPFPDEFLLQRNDLLVVMTDLTQTASILGSPAFIPQSNRFLHNQRLGKVHEISPNIDRQFLYHLFNSEAVRGQIKGSATGATVRHTAPDRICAVKIPIPPLPTQCKIAAILSAYDDLIENNLRRIKVLEEMAQNLYREWFVKFRFPGHEQARFVDSPLGRIPEGWDVTEVRNLFEIKYGKTLPKTKIAEVGPYPVYGAGDVIGYYDKVLCQEKCALVTSRGNGSGTVWRTREAAFVTNNSLLILPKVEFKHWDYSFVELLLRHSNVMEAKTGSAQPQVTIENLNYVKAIVPERPCVEKFCSLVTPISEQVDLYLLKNATLRRTRDLLLPRLISGEVDVSELDIAVPEETGAL